MWVILSSIVLFIVTTVNTVKRGCQSDVNETRYIYVHWQPAMNNMNV